MFTRVRNPGGWFLGSVVTATEFEKFDAMRPKALDGDAGGTYAPSALLSIGGLAITLNPTTLTLSATAMAVSAPGTWSAAQTANAGWTFAGAVALNGATTIGAAGTVTLNGTQPASNADPGANRVHSTNTEKAWGNITTNGAGSYTVNDGFNIASCTVTSTYVEVTWARAFASANYAPTVTAEGSGISTIVANIRFADQTTTKTRIFFCEVFGGSSAINPATTAVQFAIRVSGRH